MATYFHSMLLKDLIVIERMMLVGIGHDPMMPFSSFFLELDFYFYLSFLQLKAVFLELHRQGYRGFVYLFMLFRLHFFADIIMQSAIFYLEVAVKKVNYKNVVQENNQKKMIPQKCGYEDPLRENLYNSFTFMLL